mgnify:CR=1 FL=1
MNELTNDNSANFDLSSLDLLDLSDPFFPDEMSAEINGEKYFVFFLDTEIYAVPSKNVAEIFQPLGITPLPNVPNWLLGVTNFRNEIISVVDLQRLWKKEDILLSPKAKLVVLRSENDESTIAFVIDKFSEIVPLADESIQRIKDPPPCIFGATTHKSSDLRLINAEELLSLSF